MIEFREIGKRYSDDTVAVAGFNLVVPSHRTVALVGSSGSGKTTLLRMVNRMIDPTEGAVLIDGRDVGNGTPCSCGDPLATCCRPAG
jgi:osmoprotectant transport system ATP-binding protein